MLKFAQQISASYLLYAMNKLRLSAYLCTPSGNPKLCLGSVCPFCTIFPKPGGRSRLFAPKTTASSRFKLHSARCLRNALHFYPHIGIKSHVHAAAFYEFKPLSILYRRGDPMWSPVYIPQYKKRKKHRLRVTPSFAWAQFVHSALFSQSPAVAHTCSLSNAKQALRLVVRLRNALHFYPHIVGTKRSLFRRRRGDPQWSPVYCPLTMRTIRDLSLCGRSPLHIAQFIRLSLIIRIDGGRCVKKRGKNIFFYIADMSRVFAHAVKNIENMPVMKL